jgi:hypothetical protein
MPLKGVVLRVLTPEEREARERARKEAKTAAQKAVKVRPLPPARKK